MSYSQWSEKHLQEMVQPETNAWRGVNCSTHISHPGASRLFSVLWVHVPLCLFSASHPKGQQFPRPWHTLGVVIRETDSVPLLPKGKEKAPKITKGGEGSISDTHRYIESPLILTHTR